MCAKIRSDKFTNIHVVQNQTGTAKVSDKTEDRRLAKTRESLCHALFSLMGDTAWDAITIKTICQKANVARSSFYAHFQNKTELLEYLIAQSVHSEPKKQHNSPLGLLEWLIDHISANRALFARIVESPDAQQVLHKFKSALAVQLIADLQKHGHVVTQSVALYMLGGTVELIHAWAKTWQKNKLQNLRKDILSMSNAILGAQRD
jgi:AcrR family transcriptional regulator